MVIKLFKTHLEYCKGHFQRFYCKSIEFHWEKNNVLDQKEKTWKLKKEFLAKNIRNGIYISSTESARSPVYVRFQMSSSSSELTFPGPWNPHVSDCVSRSDVSAGTPVPPRNFCHPGPAQIFCHLFISALLVNNRSLFPTKCQYFELYC